MPSPGELASKEPLSPEGALRQVSVPDTGGMWRGPNPSLCSAQSPSSLGPASKPSLLCVPPGAGFRDNASCSGGVGPGTAPACPPCSCLFSCPIPTPFCPLSWAWVGVWGQLGYVGSLCLAWGCAHREPHSGQGSVEGPWPSSMPVSGLTLGPLHRETLSIPTPASVSPYHAGSSLPCILSLAQLTGTTLDHFLPRAFLPLPGHCLGMCSS